GWGFPKYVVKELGPMAGTRVAPDPNAPKAKRFVSLGGEPQLLRSNSRLPVVVYVPADAEVRLRVWKAVPDPVVVPEG
ncbi:MAG: ecotin family protein, partial [Planctomycetota bacterium]